MDRKNKAVYTKYVVCRAVARGKSLRGANLSGANLSDADLSDANISGANLRGADLSDANISGADLSDANISGADLRGADLIGATWDYMTIGIHAAPQGELIVYKKLAGGTISTLKVPHDAKRLWATTRKMRVSKALVLSGEGVSGYDPKFVYKVGEWVEVANFDDNRWIECSFGIHCFLTIEEAQEWNL
jgi:hypothetical protein